MTFAPPKDYAAWSAIIEALTDRSADEEVLAAMRAGSIEWQAGVADRFARKLTDAVSKRLNGATDRFQKEMNRAAGAERAIVCAITALRRELAFLLDVMSISAIPDDHRERFRDIVKDQAASIQRSLDDSARRDRSGRLASIVRKTRTDIFGDDPR